MRGDRFDMDQDGPSPPLQEAGGRSENRCAGDRRRDHGPAMRLDAEAGRSRLRRGGSGTHLRRNHRRHHREDYRPARTDLPAAAPGIRPGSRQAQEAALERYRALCRETGCDFEERDSFVYSLTNHQALEEELEALSRTGAPAVLIREPPLPFPVAGAVQFPRQAQFHPLKFLAAIAKDLPVYEYTRVLAWQPGSVRTERGTIRAEKMIAATHFPFVSNHGAYFLKLYQSRSYVVALENAPDVGGMYVGAEKTGLSLRSAEGLLLLGGGSHRTGKKGGGWQELEDAARRYYPKARTVCRWAAQDCMSLDGMPYVGRYGGNTPGLYAASGFNKWGMTGAMAAAVLLTDLVLGRESLYDGLFDPGRTVLRPQLAVNLLESAVNLLTPTAPRCPHMGCALKYNRQEHSWDCPCHGSRFTEDGKVLDGPANGDKHM